VKVVHAIGVLLWAGLVLGSGAAEKKVKIVTTFAPVYCLAANIAGDKAEVANLLPQHASLHDYSLVPADIKKLSAADILILNGAGLESWFEKVLKEVQSRPGVKVVRLAEGVQKDLIKAEGEEGRRERNKQGQVNPHIWLDPRLAAVCATNILNALVTRDAGNASYYQKNATDFVSRLEELDREYREKTESIRGKAFLTYHNAFAYLARRYELNLAGVVEEIPEVAPSPRELGGLYSLIRAKGIKALFTEPGNRTRLAQQIASEGKLVLGELDPFESGELGSGAYEKVMRRNLANLVETLSK
jgi:zinc transport system substrate-binding protein